MMDSKIVSHALLGGAIFAFTALSVYAPDPVPAADSPTAQSAAVRGGSHDFDFIYGKWRMPNHRLK